MDYPFIVSAMTYTYARYPLEHTLTAIARQGLTHVEIWGGHPHAAVELLDSRFLVRINGLLNANGLSVTMFTPEQISAPVAVGSPDPLIREYSVRYFCRAAEAAAAMGTSRMLMTAGTVLTGQNVQQAWDLSMDSLLKIGRHAQELGVRLVLEPLDREESPLMNSLASLSEAYRRLTEIKPEVMVDLVPMFRNGEDLSDYFSHFGPDLSVIHFIDCDGRTFKHLVPGDGVMNFAPVMQAIKSHGFTGILSLELGDTYHGDPDCALARALIAIDELAENAGY
jgi:protein FrlC